MTKANLRRKTALLRVLEARLDKREDALHDLHERSQEAVRYAKVLFTFIEFFFFLFFSNGDQFHKKSQRMVCFPNRSTGSGGSDAAIGVLKNDPRLLAGRASRPRISGS